MNKKNPIQNEKIDKYTQLTRCRRGGTGEWEGRNMPIRINEVGYASRLGKRQRRGYMSLRLCKSVKLEK